MKRILLILALALLLTGCADRAVEDTTQTQPVTTVVTEPTGLYDPTSAVEQQTGGAVRAYPLDTQNYTDMAVLDDDLVLISEQAELTVLEGELCQPLQTLVTGATAPVVCHAGASYYLESSREVVLLDTALEEVRTVQMPEDILGRPVVDIPTEEIYYCTAGAVRALNIQTGLSRLVKEHSYEELTLTGCWLNATVLGCGIGENRFMYISCQTGQVLHEGQSLQLFRTLGDSWFVQRMDGVTCQRIFNTPEGELKQLNVNGSAEAVLSLQSVVTADTDEEGKLQLSLYSLQSGLRTAAIAIDGLSVPQGILEKNGNIWFMCSDGLYCWNPQLSAVTEETVYTGTLFTAQAPDENGLADCENRASVLKKHYGVRFRIGEDCLKETGGHTFVLEHQVSAINQVMDELEPVFEMFPEYFLYGTVDSGWLRLCIVRSIDGQQTYTQYWANNDCYIVICPGVDVKEAFLWGLGYAVDAHVIGNSRDLDDWNSYNPEGFAYTYDNATEITDRQYLEGENRAFIDEASMRYPTEDRARIFYYAMQPDSGELFASGYMQAKLKRFCQGIREAYGLEKKSETYPWEQYLTESLAYTK